MHCNQQSPAPRTLAFCATLACGILFAAAAHAAPYVLDGGDTIITDVGARLDRPLRQIATACQTPQSCLKQFEHAAIFDKEQTASISAQFFANIFKSSYHSFAGLSQKLYYTEAATELDLTSEPTEALLKDANIKQQLDAVNLKPILATLQLQVGFGYQVEAKEYDAESIATAGVIPISIGNQMAQTRFDAHIIGVAQNAVAENCKLTNNNAERLMCSVSPAPTVDEASYKATVNGLSTAIAGLIAEAGATAVAPAAFTLCPQIISARLRFTEETVPTKGAKTLDIPVTIAPAFAQRMQQKLNVAASCNSPANSRPNLHIEFANEQPQDINGSWGDGAASNTLTHITQGYHRTVNFYAKDDNDRFVKAWAKITDQAVKSPSLLAALVQAQASKQTLIINVASKTAKGLPNLASQLPSTSGAQAADYQQYVSQLRGTVDKD